MAVSQTATSESDQAYTLPSWFLERNVATAQDLQESKAQPEAPEGMDHKTFAELCDAICASFMPHNGRLDRKSTILFRMENHGTPSETYMLEPAWMSRAITQSTKASKNISLSELYFSPIPDPIQTSSFSTCSFSSSYPLFLPSDLPLTFQPPSHLFS